MCLVLWTYLTLVCTCACLYARIIYNVSARSNIIWILVLGFTLFPMWKFLNVEGISHTRHAFTYFFFLFCLSIEPGLLYLLCGVWHVASHTVYLESSGTEPSRMFHMWHRFFSTVRCPDRRNSPFALKSPSPKWRSNLSIKKSVPRPRESHQNLILKLKIFSWFFSHSYNSNEDIRIFGLKINSAPNSFALNRVFFFIVRWLFWHWNCRLPSIWPSDAFCSVSLFINSFIHFPFAINYKAYIFNYLTFCPPFANMSFLYRARPVLVIKYRLMNLLFMQYKWNLIVVGAIVGIVLVH